MWTGKADQNLSTWRGWRGPAGNKKGVGCELKMRTKGSLVTVFGKRVANCKGAMSTGCSATLRT